jgi:hypothetical protein
MVGASCITSRVVLEQRGSRWAAEALLSGAVVATLWMFPLLNALSSAPVWLQWTVRDSLETLAAWAVGASLVALTIAPPARAGSRRTRDAVEALWLLAGAFFVAGALVKVDGIIGYIGNHRQIGGLIVATVGVLLATIAAWLVWHPGRHVVTRVQRVPRVLWPLILLFLFNLVRSPSLAADQSARYSPGPPALPAVAPAAPRDGGAASRHARTVILLFDELSPDYVYGQRAISLADMPGLRRLVDQSQIYRAAHLHGGATAIAIPALFGATPASPRGLVPTLQAAGLSVRVWGWYHDYCAAMARAADQCRSNSIYNPRTLHDGFSIVDPWWTDANLLPAEFPFALLKAPTGVALQTETVSATRAWLATQLADPGADVIYAHVSVPHLPIIGTPPKGAPRVDPFKLTEPAYLSQFPVVDAIAQQVLDSATRPTQLIVLSDHNARPLLPRPQHEHVVFMRWRSWVSTGRTIEPTTEAATLVSAFSLKPWND